jgi:hypothetical protein
MTDEDQNAALGRLMTRFADAKKRRAALLSEGQLIGRQLEEVGSALKSLEFVHAFWTGRPDGYARNRADLSIAAPYPEAAQVTRLLDDLRTISAEIRELRQLLKDAGAELE